MRVEVVSHPLGGSLQRPTHPRPVEGSPGWVLGRQQGPTLHLLLSDMLIFEQVGSVPGTGGSADT